MTYINVNYTKQWKNCNPPSNINIWLDLKGTLSIPLSIISNKYVSNDLEHYVFKLNNYYIVIPLDSFKKFSFGILL